ncbi:MAG: seg, partial [Parcubacteria group bacterium]|nr:seg [Parcubacteria group bacterium]
MRSSSYKSTIFLLVLLVAGFTFPLHATHAGWLDVTGDVLSIVLQPIATILLKLTSLLTLLTGTILNSVVQLTIVDMAKNYGNLPAISEAWSTVRDLANMAFIFVLLYAAIQTILGVGKDTKGLIVRVVIAAVLMNFSLFFTKIVIDAANLIALTFYHAIAPGAASSSGLNAGLADSLMRPLDLQSIFNINKIPLKPTTNIIIGVMGSGINVVATFIFLSIAVMFIIRYVILILVLILSPIAVLAHILPQMDKLAKQWKDALFGQAFFAPAYMIMTWITIHIFASMF